MTDDVNSQHKQRVTKVFDTIASGYDNAAMRFFYFTADRLVDMLKPLPGQKVLDIAAGTGAFATGCAQAVKPGGRVMAIDLSDAMLGRLSQNAVKLGLTNIDIFQMDAEQLEFRKNHFDHTVCSFGLFFVPDMGKALKEWVRVTKPGGSVMFTSFSDDTFGPMAKMFIDQLEALGVAMNDPPFATQRLSSPDVCRALMADAGLESIELETIQAGYHLQCVDDWWAIVWNSGMRGLVQRLEEPQQQQFKSQHLEDVQALFAEQGLWLNVEVMVSHGRAPAA